jgi:hypothetical protein
MAGPDGPGCGERLVEVARRGVVVCEAIADYRGGDAGPGLDVPVADFPGLIESLLGAIEGQSQPAGVGVREGETGQRGRLTVAIAELTRQGRGSSVVAQCLVEAA